MLFVYASTFTHSKSAFSRAKKLAKQNKSQFCDKRHAGVIFNIEHIAKKTCWSPAGHLVRDLRCAAPLMSFLVVARLHVMYDPVRSFDH